MRILPISLWWDQTPPAELAIEAQRASALTHRHPRSQMACALYCFLVHELLRGAAPEDALRASLKTFGQLYEHPAFVAERLHFQLLEAGSLGRLPESDIDSSGYVMHTLIA